MWCPEGAGESGISGHGAGQEKKPKKTAKKMIGFMKEMTKLMEQWEDIRQVRVLLTGVACCSIYKMIYLRQKEKKTLWEKFEAV